MRLLAGRCGSASRPTGRFGTQLAASLAADRATAQQKQDLLDLVADPEAERDDRNAHTELDAQVHRAMYAAARNNLPR